MSWAEFHPVACRGPPSLAAFALPPSRGPVSPRCPALSPASNEPSPAADGKERTHRRRGRQALKAGSIFGSDVTSGERSPARDCSRGTAAPEPGGRAVARAGGGAGSGRRRPARAPRAPLGRLRSPGCTPARAGRFLPRSPRVGPGGVEEKCNLPVIAPPYLTGGETSRWKRRSDTRIAGRCPSLH